VNVAAVAEQLALFPPPWPRPSPERIAAIKAWSRGHTCERCGHGCGETEHHIACCGTESQHRHTVGSYCNGHPCPDCRDVEA
jgi:hypothetical protein